MNRAAELIAALDETPGEFVSRKEIYRRMGCYAILNNAASEARKQGFDVTHLIVAGEHGYMLGAGGAVVSALPPDDDGVNAPCAEPAPIPPSPQSGQLELVLG